MCCREGTTKGSPALNPLPHFIHPQVPRSDRLRGWYHDVLRRAREEGTVVGISTLWDSYFEGGR